MKSVGLGRWVDTWTTRELAETHCKFLELESVFERNGGLPVSISGGLPFNSVGVYRVRSVDSKSNV
jgi:hypothetical protein